MKSTDVGGLLTRQWEKECTLELGLEALWCVLKPLILRPRKQSGKPWGDWLWAWRSIYYIMTDIQVRRCFPLVDVWSWEKSLGWVHQAPAVFCLYLQICACLSCTPHHFWGWKPAKFLHLYSGSRLCVEISRYLVDLEVVLSWVTAASILRRRDSWVSEGTKYKSRRFPSAAVVGAEQGFRLWGCLWCVSLLETSEGCMPSIHAVLPKQDINEAFFQAETDVVACYCGQCWESSKITW